MKNTNALSEGGVLYCSEKCLEADGAELSELVHADDFDERGGTTDFGALCPHCEREYHGY